MLHVGQFSGQLHVETGFVGREMSEATQQFLEVIVRQTIIVRDPSRDWGRESRRQMSIRILEWRETGEHA